MGNLKGVLPKITKKVLEGEDEVTKWLVEILLEQVISIQNRQDPYPTIRRSLDDAINKEISSGKIDMMILRG